MKMVCPFCEGDGVIDQQSPNGRSVIIEAIMYCVERGTHVNGNCPHCTIGPAGQAVGKALS